MHLVYQPGERLEYNRPGPMKVILFGASGMIGQGVLRECLRDPGVSLIRIVGRSASGVDHPKVRETVHPDLLHYSSIAPDLAGFDACFFCLGVSSAGMREADYERITYGITLAAGETLARLNPGMTFVYVSGAGTDSSERGSTMWARVKGRTENALLALPFKAAYMFRPGIIQPLDGIRAKTPSYRIAYAVLKPVLPLLRWMFPAQVLTTEKIGQAMLIVAREGAPKKVLESRDIDGLTRTRGS
jgi:uncharacterized protein YbjT (DUF2867 family)